MQTEGGLRIISPLGEWKDWLFSDEIINGEKIGYKITIHKGYLFERVNIFNDYVSDLYKIKENSISGSPMYIISKLLLNSLYGRFGMDPVTTESIIINDDELYTFIDK